MLNTYNHIYSWQVYYKVNCNNIVVSDIRSMQFCKSCLLWFQILDVAVSLAKVADVDRSLGNEDVAVDGFREAVKLLESLELKSEDTGLEQRVRVPGLVI